MARQIGNEVRQITAPYARGQFAGSFPRGAALKSQIGFGTRRRLVPIR